MNDDFAVWNQLVAELNMFLTSLPSGTPLYKKYVSHYPVNSLWTAGNFTDIHRMMTKKIKSQ